MATPTGSKTMRRQLLLDDGPKSLAPIFSIKVSTIAAVSMIIVCTVLILTWPRQAPYMFVLASRTPQTFLIVSALILIICSYTSLYAGRGELIENSRIYMQLYQNVLTWEETLGFFSHGLPVALFQLVIFATFFAPPLFVSAALVQVPASLLWRFVCLILATAFLCRMAAFLCFLLWGRWHILGWIATRLFYILFMFGSLPFTPYLNPLRVLYEPMRVTPNQLPGMGKTYNLYMAVVLFTILVLIIINYAIWRHNRNKRAIEQDRLSEQDT
jgi:hypothetical protein